MNPALLIVAGLYDFSADLVALRLTEAGVGFLRLNREDFPDLRLRRVALTSQLQAAFDKMLDPILDCLLPHLIACECAEQVIYDFLNIWGYGRSWRVERQFNKILGAIVDRKMIG